MTGLLYVVAGGGLGAGFRYGVGLAASRWFGLEFPWGTMLCNVAGSLAMGLLIGWLALVAVEDARLAENARLLLGVGLLGGFTTFSTFSLDAYVLWQRGDLTSALAYVASSLILSVGGLALGLKLTRGAWG